MWFCWEPQGTKGNPWVLICTKKIQNPSRNGWVIAVFHQEVCDSIEKHIGLKGMPGCYVIVPNRSKISQEKAELLQFSTKVVLFHWEPHRTKKEPLVFICTKKIQKFSRKGWVMAIFPVRGCTIPLRTMRDKRGPWILICTKKIQYQ